jgi:hypothetical protein
MKTTWLRIATIAPILALVVGATASAHRAPPRPAPPGLTPDQEAVVVEVVNDTFRPAHSRPLPLVLCLDVQLTELAPDEPPPRASAPARFPHRSRRPPKPPPPPTIRGVSDDVIDRLTRPWRRVVSASACQLDPPFTLKDPARTPAQLVTVRMQAKVAAGPLTIEWTGVSAADQRAISSRTCVAATGPRGWSATCAGTWFE